MYADFEITLNVVEPYQGSTRDSVWIDVSIKQAVTGKLCFACIEPYSAGVEHPRPEDYALSAAMRRGCAWIDRCLRDEESRGKAR